MTVSETSENMVEALPCPFCGTQPVIQNGDSNATHPYSAIRCENDECLGPRTTAAFMDDALFQWNTRALTAALSDQAGGWQQDISTAPKDGKVDLLYPYPRGRTNDCEWRQGGIYGDGGWYWSRPTWTSDLSDYKLLPESEWQTGSYPNMQPTHWMRPPAPPASSTAGEVG